MQGSISLLIGYDYSVEIGESLLPRQDDLMAPAYYNNSIWLFGMHLICICVRIRVCVYVSTHRMSIFLFPGGESNRWQLIEYDIATDNFIDHGPNCLGRINGITSMLEARGYGQFYTQRNELFYWIDWKSSGSKIYVYDLSTQNLSNQINLTRGLSVGQYGCIASYHDMIYIVGGWNNNYVNELQIYNTSNQTWQIGPSLAQSRRGHACIVEPLSKTLYAIGGFAVTYSTSIEKIQIANHVQMYGGIQPQWSYFNDHLEYGVVQTRAVVYDEDILIIGGFQMNLNQRTYIDKSVN